ncbi:MAG: hypothetical protein Q7Q71_08485 [Verrucomicrobiota bacterium JB023]|nr:hypothetical protein [Verrucomicrobiota bacterium JB023]
MRRMATICWLLCLAVALGQEEVERTRKLRILPVGDAPPFRQEIRDGVRYELDAPKGSEPPYLVEASVQSAEEEGEGGGEVESQELRLRLKSASAPLAVPKGPALVRLAEEGAPWHQLTLPEGGDVLAVLWRDPQEGDWGKARSLLLTDGPGFAAGMVRFVNVCPAEVAVKVAGREIQVKPGESEVLRADEVDGVKMQLAYKDARRGWRRFYSASLSQGKGQRSTIVAYRADGEKPRQPVKVVMHRETAPVARENP